MISVVGSNFRVADILTPSFPAYSWTYNKTQGNSKHKRSKQSIEKWTTFQFKYFVLLYQGEVSERTNKSDSLIFTKQCSAKIKQTIIDSVLLWLRLLIFALKERSVLESDNHWIQSYWLCFFLSTGSTVSHFSIPQLTSPFVKWEKSAHMVTVSWSSSIRARDIPQFN